MIKTGTILKPIKEKLFSKVALPAAADECWNWIGSKSTKGYGILRSGTSKLSSYRVMFELYKGPIDPGSEIDHVCHNKGCVNPEHLRQVTTAQNQQNRRGPNSDSQSGVLGVHWCKRARKWKAQIKFQGKVHHLGSFAEIEDAIEARGAGERAFFTHAANGRVVAS